MKKLFALVLVLILIVSMCACNNAQVPNNDNKQSQIEDNQQMTNSDNKQSLNDNDSVHAKYKLTVIDYWGYLVKPLNEYYKAGEEVEVTLAFLSGPSVGIELNGEYFGENADTKYDGVYPVITFTMPAKDSVLYTTQNGHIGFVSTFSRASYGIPNIYDNALNASKLGDSNPFKLPIYKFDTLSDLEKFKSDFGGKNGFNYGWDEVPSLNDATKNYDEDFFERYTLMLVYIVAGSGSYRFGFKDVTLDGNYFCIHIEQTNNPQIGTDDMAGWFITVAVPDSMIANITEFDANFISNEKVPEETCKHIWDSGIEVEGGIGAYVMEYTCTVCGEKKQQIITIIPPEPVSNLEFWIGDNVDNVDFSTYQEKYGLFGGKEYYGTGYIPTIDEYGQQIDPEHCVIYTVTSYPDYSDKEQHITRIYITDPNVEFFGISLNSSFENFEYYIQQQGFEITHSNENSRTAKKGKYSITFTKEWIRVRAEVENKDGIIF